MDEDAYALSTYEQVSRWAGAASRVERFIEPSIGEQKGHLRWDLDADFGGTHRED